jgi:chemotaxis protein methyltransferase CheR
MSPELSEAQFHTISQLLHRLCGITLKAGKEGLVKARLAKRLRALHLSSFEAYLAYLERDPEGQELAIMVDALTTNKTSFFREPQHFDYLRQQILPQLLARGDSMRFWSAGCSSGEEPLSLAMLLWEEIPDLDRRDVRILATDISTTVLTKARQAIYPQDVLRDVPAQLVQTYFTKVQCTPPCTYQVNEKVKALIRLAQLNLMGPWPMRGPFDVIFCRNVMIYFDKPTQQRLVQRFGDLLAPGGHLFVGHAESLAGASHRLHYVQPAIYVK